MKILVDALPMTGLLTGIARYLRNLYGAMAQTGQAEIAYFNGNHVTYDMPPLAESKKWQKTTGTLRRLPDPLVFGMRAARWLKYEYKLNALFRPQNDFACHVYHETAFNPAKLTRVPTVFSMYDLSLRRYSETQPRERVWLFEYFIKTRLPYANHILTISEFIKQEIMDEFRIPADRITAIPLAPDPLFCPCPEDQVQAVREQYHLPSAYLLFVSSLEPRKNIDLLITALEKTQTDIPLVLAGWHGWGQKAWLDKIRTTALKNRVIFTGHVPDRHLQAIYSGATALVYPSLYEGFGLPILEAMACGCPVICSHAASMPEVGGDAALFIHPAKSDELAGAIEKVVHDTHFREQLMCAGFRQSACFTWQKTAEKTLDLFKQVAP